MMGGGASLRQGGGAGFPTRRAGINPGGASSPRNPDAGWTEMAALRTTLVCSAATPLCVCVRACARLYVCVFACLRVCVFGFVCFPLLFFSQLVSDVKGICPLFPHFQPDPFRVRRFAARASRGTSPPSRRGEGDAARFPRGSAGWLRGRFVPLFHFLPFCSFVRTAAAGSIRYSSRPGVESAAFVENAGEMPGRLS